MKTRILLIIMALIILPLQNLAQKSLKEWSEFPEKKWNKQLTFNSYLNNLKRYVNTEDQKPKIKKVGLLTFYMFTPSPTQRNINLLRPAQITHSGSDYIVDMLFYVGYPGLVSGFEKKGISLLKIEEFLDTQEKMDLYHNTEFEPSALGKGTAKWAAKLSGRAWGGDARATPEGYKLITEANWDIKLMRTIGDFCKKVDIDAVLCVQHQISWDGEVLYWGPLTMSLIGPNPVPESEDDWYAPMGPLKGYLEGFIYGAVIVQQKDFMFLGYTKKTGMELNFWDMHLVYDRSVQSLMDYVNKEIGKLVKK